MKYIRRQIESKIIKFLKQFPAVILTGPRQSGKSTLLKELLTPEYRYISLEEPSVRESILSEPKLYLETLPGKVIFDEVQYAPEILIHIKSEIDRERNKKGSFVLTGSQQFRMMKNVSETLAGRVGLLNLLPFSHGEIKTLLKREDDSRSIFFRACLSGSYPELATHPGFDARAWYDSYIQTYIERDIRSIYNIGSLRDFHGFIKLTASRCAQQINMNGMSNDLGVAVNTVKSWLSVLESSYLIYLLPPFYKNIGKRIIKSPKLYFTDCGLVCHFLNIRDENMLMNNPFTGALFENYFIQEIVKYFENRGERPELFYIRTKTGNEIDLLLETRKGLLPVEIKLTKSPTRNMAEGMEYFYRSIGELDLLKGYIVSLVDSDLPLTENITACNIHSFLEKLEF